jgi:glycine/D-amino acid oxidase-like deaminating enzyme
VVVGTGIAGCSTALNCLEHGLSVVMFEKGPATGGTSAKAAGGMMVPNNRYLQELGDDDRGRTSSASSPGSAGRCSTTPAATSSACPSGSTA